MALVEAFSGHCETSQRFIVISYENIEFEHVSGAQW